MTDQNETTNVENVTIGDLASWYLKVKEAEDKYNQAVEAYEGSPEYLALQAATDLANSTSQHGAAVHAVKQLELVRETYAKKVSAYKAIQLARFDKDGTKEYPGGNIRVTEKTELAIDDPGALVELLIEKNYANLLSPNIAAMSELNRMALDMLGIGSHLVRFETVTKPTASLAKDLSAFASYD